MLIRALWRCRGAEGCASLVSFHPPRVVTAWASTRHPLGAEPCRAEPVRSGAPCHVRSTTIARATIHMALQYVAYTGATRILNGGGRETDGRVEERMGKKERGESEEE